MTIVKKTIYWLPRVLSIFFILFLSLFSFDIFSEYRGWEAILPLLIHLLPPLILIAVTMIAWKYDLTGAAVFIFLAAYYVWTAGLDRPWSWYASISGPAMLVGLLFLAGWLQKRSDRSGMS